VFELAEIIAISWQRERQLAEQEYYDDEKVKSAVAAWGSVSVLLGSGEVSY